MPIMGEKNNENELGLLGFKLLCGDFCDGIWKLPTLFGENIAAAEGAITRAAAIITTMRYRSVRFMR